MDSNKLTRTDIGAIVSLCSYIVLAAAKISVSYLAHSQALRADGFNNLTDIGASIAVIIGLRLSRRPRDSDHPYGHSRIEQIASLVASFIMMAVGLQVIYNGFIHLFTHDTESPTMLALWVALGSATFMLFVYRFNMKIAKAEKSMALAAAAKDNLSDALVSFGTVIGVIGSYAGFPILDSIMAIIVGGVICKTAWEIFSDASHLLTDGFNPEDMETYKKAVESVNGVDHLVDLKARMYGNDVFVDVTVKVEPNLDIKKGHEIADDIERILAEKHQISYTHVHLEPL